MPRVTLVNSAGHGMAVLDVTSVIPVVQTILRRHYRFRDRLVGNTCMANFNGNFTNVDSMVELSTTTGRAKVCMFSVLRYDYYDALVYDTVHGVKGRLSTSVLDMFYRAQGSFNEIQAMLISMLRGALNCYYDIVLAYTEFYKGDLNEEVYHLKFFLDELYLELYNLY